VNEIRIIPVEGVPEVRPGDEIGTLLFEACGSTLEDDDVVVVTQKVASKAEGRLVPAAERPAAIERESARILRRVGDMTISETHHGLVCANAGVDASNVRDDDIALLPVDPDLSARRVRSRLEHLSGKRLGVIISDTFGRAWRIGQTDVAIGIAGIECFIDYRGTVDTTGNLLSATMICIADEIAGAAELVMGKATGVCAAIVRGAPAAFGSAAATDIARAPIDDLFR
jgi:coenzyme F420-0:L-glutamate ligase/coenzyme F420-1:gamma-L-glutamate ligase